MFFYILTFAEVLASPQEFPPSISAEPFLFFLFDQPAVFSPGQFTLFPLNGGTAPPYKLPLPGSLDCAFPNRGWSGTFFFPCV